MCSGMVSFLRKKQKAFLGGLLLLQLFVVSASPVSAGLFGGPSIPSASSMLSGMEKRYHLDVGSIQSQGENFNTADVKKPTPEASLFFNPSDPKSGEKISAKAFPMYFSNSESELYYTWYLKRAECGLTNTPSDDVRTLCDRDSNGRITVEDWKIEAAQILAENGFDKADANYNSDTDNDGYKARFGGDNKVSTPNHCYVNDSVSGKNYELGDAGDINFDCPDGKSPMCMEGEQTISPEDITVPGDGGVDTTSQAFSFTESDVCNIAGIPACGVDGVPKCSVGAPRCVSNAKYSTSCGTELTTCSGGGGGFNTYCAHLFPVVPGHVTGDGSFGADEEDFWGTDPADPDTADNGNKDEANVTGLGQSTFTWNYSSGDQVGLAVEGTSMITTKYDDSSSMIMWAFSKKDCPLSLADETGSFFKTIKGYEVTMYAADIDLNKCLERNLVDPTQGGQATNLEVSVSASPDAPINDETEDAGGDLVIAEASVGNAVRGVNEILFEWDVEISDNPQFRSGGDLVSAKITSDLQRLKLLGSVKGTALDTVRLKLDILNNGSYLLAGRQLDDYLTGDIGYLRFTAKVSENFASGSIRKGKSDVVVKFTSTGKKISAYKVNTQVVGDGTQVLLPTPLASGLICNDDPLDRAACRVIKNEIIGLRVDPTDLTNFQWTINGTKLFCNRSVVSQDCEKDASGAITVGQQNFVNFFPISGNVGDAYAVTMTANDVKTGKTVTLSRAFHVIDPELSIESVDPNTAWPKLVGQYKDVDGAASLACPNGYCSEYSDSIFEGFSGENLSFKAAFLPNFLADRAVRQWTVDGVSMTEGGGMSIAFTALKEAPDVYNIGLSAAVVQPQGIRQALRDIWNISPLDSPEIHFSATDQVELKEPGFAQGTLPGAKKYLATLASYIPTSVMFSFRILLSVVLILFTTRFFLVLLPERLELSQLPFRKR